MSMRGLLLATVALALLAGGVYWSESRRKAEEAKPKDEAPKLIGVSEDQAKKVEIRKTGGDTTVLERDAGNKWRITAPQPLATDQDAASGVVSSLTGLTWQRLVDEKAGDLARFGLNAPKVEVVLTTKDGKTRKVLVGDETPTQGGFFSKLEGDPRVFTIASWTKESIDKTSKDLRDKRLLTFDSEKLTRVELYAKGQAIEFGKNNQNEWTILKPRPLRADNLTIEELVRKLKDAKMDTSVSDEDAKKASSEFASGTGIGTARVTDAAGTQQIEVRKKGDNYYARSSVVEGVHKAANELGEALDKKLEDFRNKKLFDFGFSDPNKVELRDGTKTYSFAKSGDKWTSGGKTMDSTSVQALVDKLRDLASIKFVESGFTTPAIEITVTSNDGKRVEKVLISKSGDSWFAKRENEPAIYELDGKAVEEIQRAAADVKEAKK